MSKNSITPIKFKSFLNHWSYTRLKEVKDVRDGTHSSPKYIDNGYLLVTSKNLTDSGLNLNDVSLISESDYNEINKRSKVEVGDILLGLIGTIGKPVLVEIDGFAIKNVGLIKNGGKIQNQFLLQYLKTNLFNKYIQIEMAGNTQKFLGLETLRNTKVPVPSPEEQSAIGSLFRTLDDLLASYKDNLTNYQSLKATMLSKMFPKAGQSVPEIRLDGFEGEWECLKIAEIFQIIDGDRGKSYPGESDFYSVGHTLFLDTGNVKKSGLDFSTTKFISEEKDKELRNGKLILGDFILTSRGTLGNVAYYNENIQKRYSSVRINSAMLILRPLLGDKISPDYILAVLRGNLISDFMKVNQVGSAQPHITKKEFSKIKVLVPSNIREQQAIGAYFSNLDNLINSYREKISQLETLKKKLLQEMFI